MKTLLPLFAFVFLFGCQDDQKQRNQADDLTETPEYSGERDSERVKTTDQPEIPDTSQDDVTSTDTKETESVASFNGRYRKVVEDTPVTDCTCNCIDVAFGTPTEWCIVQDKVYINARCEKTGPNSADLYFVGASRDANAGRELPWDDFDTTTPIATLAFQPDGTAELDWLGFSINGEIATDYAIYGKKTLEGTYVRD